LYSESKRIFHKIQSLDELLRDLEIDYEAKFETYRESGKDKKIERLKEEFSEKRTIYLKKREKYCVEERNLWKKKKLVLDLDKRNMSKLQVFMDILAEIEGKKRLPVSRQTLIDRLVQTGFFSDIQAVTFIQRMIREANIYESKPEHYNRV